MGLNSRADSCWHCHCLAGMSVFKHFNLVKAPILTVLGALCLSASGQALSLEDLRKDSRLTPRRFASYFSEFKYQFHAQMQSPDVFLTTQSGDCDDFATLAATVLREKGYTPRLIAVRMGGLAHVVCYIEETQTYLDYNNRGFVCRTVGCEPSIKSIAKSVAKSFDLPWISASEFTCDEGLKRLVVTVPSEKAVARAASRAPALAIARF